MLIRVTSANQWRGVIPSTGGGRVSGHDYHSCRTECLPERPDDGAANEAYDPNKLGWGFAAAIIVLAVVANVDRVFSLHKATYLKPDKAPAAEAAAH